MTTTNPDSTATSAAAADGGVTPLVRSTATRGTRILGVLTIVSMVWLVAFGLGFSPADRDQAEAVRLLYVHVPTIWVAYLAFVVTAIASAMVLFKRRSNPLGWDRLAGASAEVGTAFVAVTLVVGALWGRLTWGVFWQWDARLTTTALLFVTYIGYLAVRRLDGTHQQRAKRSAVIGLVAVLEIPLVHWSVRLWRSLHQEATVLNTTRRHRDGRPDVVQPVHRRHRLHLLLRLVDDAPHPGDGDGGPDRRSRPRRSTGGPPAGKRSSRSCRRSSRSCRRSPRRRSPRLGARRGEWSILMEDAGFIIGSYALTFGVVGLLAAWVIRSGRRLARRTPDDDKYWT